MKTKRLTLILFTAISLLGCSGGTTVLRNELPPVYPDYIGVTVPAGIAPLDFNLPEEYSDVYVKVYGSRGGELSCRGDYARFNIRKWHALLDKNIGDTLTFRVLAKKEGQWVQFQDFLMFVSKYPLTDYGVTYRKFAPGYETFSKIGIYQRNIHNFDESPIIEGNLVPGQCLGCHTANATSPDQFLFHMRGQHGATVFQLDGRRRWLTTKTASTISNAVYSYWHPSGDYVAHSNNHIHQLFWTGTNERYVEVFDDVSDVVIQDIRKDELLLSPLLMTEDFETYPAFSPDGRTLYYCSAPVTEVPQHAEDVHYNLCSIAFDPETGSVASSADTLINAYALKKSVTFPRPSYDGRWLLYSLSDFGNFPINHKEADLWLMDTGTGESHPLERANSDYDESFHNWSSDSHWILFSSRRDDTLYSQIYICSIDEEGNATKPFVLPQRNPWKYYHGTLFTFNVPDFTKEEVRFDTRGVFEEAFSDERDSLTVRNFSIYGTVTDPELEGVCIYLVPALEEVILPSRENLDSTFIKNGKFEFHGNVERLSDIRVDRHHRINVQNLLVLTEPGTINVTIGPVSSGGGTPQNDSLQVWKELTEKHRVEMISAGDSGVRDSIHHSYKLRSRELASNCGGQIESFINKLYPGED